VHTSIELEVKGSAQVGLGKAEETAFAPKTMYAGIGVIGAYHGGAKEQEYTVHKQRKEFQSKTVEYISLRRMRSTIRRKRSMVLDQRRFSSVVLDDDLTERMFLVVSLPRCWSARVPS